MEWTYTGDVNPENGGMWLNFEGWSNGYADCIRIVDLDSACGFTGAVMIERLTIIRPRNRKELAEILDVCGMTTVDLVVDREQRQLIVAQCCEAYGLYDLCEDFIGPHREILQLDPAFGLMEFDGWKADRAQPNGDIKGYIEAKWLY